MVAVRCGPPPGRQNVRDTMPTSARRWLILCIVFVAVVLNYFDRQIVSVLKPTLLKQFQIDDNGYALLVNAFQICYACMYPVAGWLVDRLGARIMMPLGIFAWSAACIGAGLSRSLGGFTVCRALLGLAEPIAFPAQLRVITTWFPGRLRATANSISVAGGTFGSIIAPPLVAYIALTFDWRSAFLVPGTIGLGVVVLWFLIYRDPPADASEVNVAGEPSPVLAQPPAPAVSAVGETAVLDYASSPAPAFTWSALWTTRTLWALILIRFVSDPVWYFCLFWFPGYLQEKSGLSLGDVGKVGWIPFLAADVGGILTAVWSDRMVARGASPLSARKKMLCTVALFGPLCALTPYYPHPAATLAIFSVVGAICLSWLFSLSVVIAESFPAANVGSVLGIAAGFGSVGAIVFNTFVGKMMSTVGSANLFIVMAVLHPIAAIILWKMVRPEKPGVTA